MWRRVPVVRVDVAEERAGPTFRVERISELGTALATSKKTVFFIAVAVKIFISFSTTNSVFREARTSNLTQQSLPFS
jgi:hypothetical protein